jgi:hypothetical protein
MGNRRLFEIDKQANLVEFIQGAPGRIALVVVFATLLAIGTRSWQLPLATAFAAGVVAYLPRYSALAFAIATLIFTLNRSWDGIGSTAITYLMTKELVTGFDARSVTRIALLISFIICILMIEVARRNKNSLISRRPVASLLAFVSIISVLATSELATGTFRVALFAFLLAFTPYVWFLSYALIDQRSRDRSPLPFQLGTFHAFWTWGSSATPYGKGTSFLRKFKAKTPEELAVTQLKGIKLLIWAIVLHLLEWALVWIIEGQLRIPKIDVVQASYLSSKPYPIWTGWISLIWATAHTTLWLSIGGHQTIAAARIAGFRLPRNTYRPLESRTLIEFWNRYYYYFKELLVDLFFFPTFLRTFRNHPRIRVFFATFVAAGVGNAIYHFIASIQLVVTKGMSAAVISYQSYLFYCLVLSIGIGISQLRNSNAPKRSDALISKLWSYFCVWSFVVCLHIFGDESRDHTLGDRLSFMSSLFGVN